MAEDEAAVLAALVAGVPQYVELHEEQLLELQPDACLLQRLGVGRIVNPAQCLVAAYQVQPLYDEVGQRLGHRFLNGVYQYAGEPFDSTRVHAHLLHLLRRVVVGQHVHGREFQRVGGFHVGVNHLYAVVEDGGLAEHDVVGSHLIFFNGTLAIVEPHQVHDASAAVGEVCHHALLAAAHLEGLETQYASLHLHEGHVARQFADGVEPAAVDVLVGVVFQQVAVCGDAQFLAEHLLALGAYARQVLDVLF